jgi:hypothetical protein
MTDWDLPADLNAASWERMAPITPRSYVCYATADPPRIDGRLDDEAWEDAPWTDAFVDIEGASKPAPRYETRVAMRWDERHLYIAARMEEPHVWGTLTGRNSVIFQDKDFEVFIDPDGDHHNYYELEVNALNTIWELTLEKPYRDGGPAISPTNIPGLRSAVYVEGTLNAPHDTDAYWTVEVAIPWEGLARYGTVPPEDGAQWRVNFSRVHWEHEIAGDAYRKVPETPEQNWVWSPQGVIDMHRPERWGFVQFSRAAPGASSFEPDPTLEARDALMAVYYAQKAYFEEHGEWAQRLSQLAEGSNLPSDVHLTPQAGGWTAATRAVIDGRQRTLEVHHDSRILILP